MIKAKKFSFSEFNFLPKSVENYLNGDEFMKQFVNYEPKMESFSAAIDHKKKENINRPALVEALKNQYNTIDLATAPKVKENIEKLLSNNSFTITTGHQLCLFTGPLYFIYKIFSVINLAEDLKKKHEGNAFVPVFWMATEDHDLAEIDHFSLFDKKIAWNRAEVGAVGRMDLRGIEDPLAQLKEILGNASYAAELVALFEKAYLGSVNLAEATRKLAHQIFAEHGLVVLDGDDPLLKGVFADIMANDLMEETSFKLVSQQTEKLAEQHKIQVNPREINLFYLNDLSRERIVKVDSEVVKLGDEGEHISKKELLQTLKDSPNKFSPNVILRPLYQEKILPNLAYIGGPGELSYWFQLKTMFEHYQINFPALILRNTAIWVNKSLGKKLDKLPVGIEKINQDKHVLLNEILKESSEEDLELLKEKSYLEIVFNLLSEKADTIDPTIVPMIRGEEKKLLNVLDKIQKRMIKTEKQKNQDLENQLTTIQNKLFPNASMQERIENFSSIYCNLGKEFLNQLKLNLHPLSDEVIVFIEE